MKDYGVCECGCDLEPVLFRELEYKTEGGHMYKTGRWRYAVDYLECPGCFKHYTVDDTFDGPWR